jgi:acetate kinase
MFVLAINSGSQTLKYKLYEPVNFSLVKNGEIKDIGFGTVKDHFGALEKVKEDLAEEADEIKVIGHRYVNGGTEFLNPELIDETNFKALEKYHSLAPLHNPNNFLGIQAAQKYFPKAKNVAVFDTAFYQDLPQVAKLYALNFEVTKKNHYQRLGFHGISHRYASIKAAEKLGKDFSRLKIISLHLGGGASITAIRFGRAIETSMGFTPSEGLSMMTRSGDLDPGIILDLFRQGLLVEEVDQLINRESGIYGLCGKKSMLEVLDNLTEEKTKLAFDIFVYRIKKYLGAYYAVLGGCDLLVFTGTIGSGREETRQAILDDLFFAPQCTSIAIETDEEIIIGKDAFQKYQEISQEKIS